MHLTGGVVKLGMMAQCSVGCELLLVILSLVPDINDPGNETYEAYNN